MPKILITGGAGFVGYHITKKLSSNIDNEIVIASKSIPRSDDKEFAFLLSLPNVRIIQADLTDKYAWEKVGNGFDFVYHLVSIKGFKNFNKMPQEVLRVGITSTLNALDWFRSKNNNLGAKILYASTNEVYMGGLLAFGQLPNPAPETVPCVISDPYDPRWSYGGEKLINELLFIHYSNAYNFRMTIVRPSNIYGPRAGFDGMIPTIIKRVKSHIDPFTIFGPEDTRTFCFAEDAADAFIKTMESTKTDGQTYNIGTQSLVSVREITEMIFDIINWRPQKIILENPPHEAVRNSVPDISKIKKDTGWEPKIHLEEGMKKTVAWYLTNLQD